MGRCLLSRERSIRRFKLRVAKGFRHSLPTVVWIPPFRRLWIGQAVSQFGDAMYYLVFLYMIERITRSPEMTGYAGALMQLPYLLLGFHAGVAADRLDRRRVMLSSDVLSILVMGAFFVLVILNPSPPSWTLLVTGFLLSCLAAFFDPARSAAIPALVPPDKLIEANGLGATTKTLMQLIGPIGTIVLLPLLETAGPRLFFPLAIALNLATFIYSAWCIYRLPAIDTHRTGEAPRENLFKEFLQGIQFVAKIKILRIALFLTAFINLVVAPILLGYINANRLWFAESARTFAGLQAGFFLGMVVSSLVVMKLKITHPGRSYCYGLMLNGVAVGLLSQAQNFWVFFLLNIVSGVSMPFTVIPLTTYLQIVVPDSLRGRVNSALNMITNLLLPIGWVGAGWILKRFGVERMFVGVGAVLALVGIAGMLSTTFRNATMPLEDNPQRPAVE